MDNLVTYPWQRRAWQRLTASIAGGRLPHALLVTGPDGLGKLRFAQCLAARVFCQQATEDQPACGSCGNCHLIAADSHPDLMLVTVESEKTQIAVQQIRDLIAHLGMKSYRGGAKVALVFPADAMNVNSANSLLKTLEEPTDNTLLVLVTSRPGRLPATILSRCQRIDMKAPERADALAWLSGQMDASGVVWEAALDFSGDAPLRALDLLQAGFSDRVRELERQMSDIVSGKKDPAAIASDWASQDSALCLDWLKMWTGYLIRKRSVGNLDIRLPGDRSGALRELIENIDLKILFKYLDDINRSLNLLDTSVNRQGLMEALLLPWAHGLRRVQGIAD